jgi:hypothetical protein
MTAIAIAGCKSRLHMNVAQASSLCRGDMILRLQAQAGSLCYIHVQTALIRNSQSAFRNGWEMP